jgi:hypothetical protein
MNSQSPLPQPDWSIEQLCQHFGGVPADRILLDPAPGTATEEMLLHLDSKRGYPLELLDGVGIDRIPGFRASALTTQFLCRLMDFLSGDNRGIIIPGGKCPVRLRPGLVRLASFYFINWNSIPGGIIPNDPITDLIPDLVGDVISPWTSRTEMEWKQDQFFEAGTRLFGLLDLAEESIEVSTPRRTLHLGPEETLTGGDGLPGFAIPVKDIFAMPRRRAQE